MPTHVRLILVPGDRDGLRRALTKGHRTHAGMVHARQRRTGHFWQGQFGAVAMDEACAVLGTQYSIQFWEHNTSPFAMAPPPKREFLGLSRISRREHSSCVACVQQVDATEVQGLREEHTISH